MQVEKVVPYLRLSQQIILIARPSRLCVLILTWICSLEARVYTADSRPTVEQLFQSHDSLTTVARQSPDSRTTVARQSHDSRTTVARQSHDIHNRE